MPKKCHQLKKYCSIRGCPTFGKKLQSNQTPVFSCPNPKKHPLILAKWLEALQITDYDPRVRVCIKHFEEQYIFREVKVAGDNGLLISVPRKVPVLSRTAVPSIFETKSLGIPLVRKWNGGKRRYTDTRVHQMCHVILESEDRTDGPETDKASDVNEFVEPPVFVKSEVPDPELDWVNEDCHIGEDEGGFEKGEEFTTRTEDESFEFGGERFDQNGYVLDPPESSLILVKSSVRSLKRCQTQGKGRRKERVYPCPVCDRQISRRRQMIDHMQRRHPDNEITKNVLKEKKLNPRSRFFESLSIALEPDNSTEDSDFNVSTLPSTDPLSSAPSSPKSSKSDDFSISPSVEITSSSIPVSPSNLKPVVTNSCTSPDVSLSNPPSFPLIPLPLSIPSSSLFPSSPSTGSSSLKSKENHDCASLERSRILIPCLPSPDTLTETSSSSGFESSCENTANGDLCTWDSDLEMFNVDLSDVSEEKRDILKQKLVELVEAVAVRKIHPSKVVIAYKDTS